MHKKVFFCLLLLITRINIAIASEIKTLVEFFSYNCSHCAEIDTRLNNYIARNKIKYLAVNIDNSPAAMPTNIMYYLAVDAGVGEQFKALYFKAVSTGMPVYAGSTLGYVTTQVQNATLKQLMSSKTEKQHLKQKLAYAQDLIETYKVRAVPSFLINQTTLLEGADVINSLLRSEND
jgi:protein-disulfide isomerase